MTLAYRYQKINAQTYRPYLGRFSIYEFSDTPVSPNTKSVMFKAKYTTTTYADVK